MTVRFALVAALLTLYALVVPPSASASVDDALTRSVADDGLAGGVAVVREGPLLERFSAGYSDVETQTAFVPDTHVRVASITKTFVAATIMTLLAEGRVNLDAPIETYLPGRIRGAGIDPHVITVRQLLRHQSGLPEYFGQDTPIPTEPVSGGELLDMALSRPSQFPPGTAMNTPTPTTSSPVC